MQKFPLSLICAFLFLALIPNPAISAQFTRGDVNGDGRVDIGDAIFILSYLFANGQAPLCLDAADINDNGTLDLSDPISLLSYLFSTGGPPKPPFPEPGNDPSEDSFLCGQAPQINSITPADNSTFLAGMRIAIQVNASDPDNDRIQYQFSIGGTIRRHWSPTRTYNWQTSESDTGTVTVTCEVRDNKDGVSAKTVTYQIINPTAEETLQKVADNYSLISDMQAEMILSSTLNGAPFGQTEYCRYYFKAPNKEKTQTYSDAGRTTKTEVIISDGSSMYFLDPVAKITQKIDLLTEAGISSEQFSQMDIYYNLTNFLNNHTLTRNDTETDFSNFIIALTATPKLRNELYTKLELHIDYQKGLVIKIRQNRDFELPQIIEAVETTQMPNGAWLPTKMLKNPNLSSGALISTITYLNLQINTGLTDLDFDPNREE